MIDRYTKAVLTVIAVSLTALVFQNVGTIAFAQNEPCGGNKNPCYVVSTAKQPVWILSVAR
jgi:hypothetical protein